jgi:hypothetical protein
MNWQPLTASSIRGAKSMSRRQGWRLLRAVDTGRPWEGWKQGALGFYWVTPARDADNTLGRLVLCQDNDTQFRIGFLRDGEDLA